MDIVPVTPAVAVARGRLGAAISRRDAVAEHAARRELRIALGEDRVRTAATEAGLPDPDALVASYRELAEEAL